MIERRKDPRSGVAYPVYIVCIREDGSPKDQDVATVLNISDSGILIETKIPILTQQIKILASLQDQEDVEVYAEVVYTINMEENKYRCGLSFEGDPVHIARFVGSLAGISREEPPSDL
jgi:hypothetical protein